MIPFNTQLCLLAKCHSPQHKLLRGLCSVSSPCWTVSDLTEGQADVALAVFQSEGSNWPHSWHWGWERRPSWRQRVRAVQVTPVCSSPPAASRREGWDLIDISEDPGFVSSLCLCLCLWLGLSPTLVLFHLHGCDSNRCAGLKEIRLRDPQFKIN